MSQGFEVTDEDVQAVMFAMGHPIDFDEASGLLAKLDVVACAKAALRGDDMDDQTEAAHGEIRRQLEAMGCGAAIPSSGM